MTVDAHHHLWKYTAEEFGWIADDALRRDFSPSDLKRELYYDYDLIHKENEEKPTSKNLSAIFSYTLWDNERQRPLFSAVEEIQQPIVKLTMDDMKSLIATAARKVRVSLYEGARQ